MLQIQDCNGILQEPIGKVNGVAVFHEKPQKRNLGKIPNSTSGKKSKEAAVLHALAEKGRRKRINEHLQTLRRLFPELAKVYIYIYMFIIFPIPLIDQLIPCT